MDPASVLAIVNGSLDLALKCGSVVKSLHDVVSKYKYAELFLVSMIDECQAFRLAWGRIQSWAQRQQESTLTVDDQLVERLCSSLATGTMVFSALEQDLVHLGDAAVPVGSLGFRRWNKIIWNEQVFREHQDRLRGQIGAMTLLLEVVELPTSTEQTDLLTKEEHVLKAADESAWTISAKARGKRVAQLAPVDRPTTDVDDDVDTIRGYIIAPSAQLEREASEFKENEWQTFLKTIREEYKSIPIEVEDGQVPPMLPEPLTEREAIELQSWPTLIKGLSEEHEPKTTEIQDGQAFSTLTEPFTEKLADGGDFDNQHPWQAFLKQAGENHKPLPIELHSEIERDVQPPLARRIAASQHHQRIVNEFPTEEQLRKHYQTEPGFDAALDGAMETTYDADDEGDYDEQLINEILTLISEMTGTIREDSASLLQF